MTPRTDLRRACLTISRVSRLQRIFRRDAAGPTVLFYHGVEQSVKDPRIQGLQIPLAMFERHMAFLRREFEIISMDDLWASIAAGRRPDPKQVVITFDDGYRNNRTVVAPLLAAWKMPFAVFVSTKHISEGCMFPLFYVRVAALRARTPVLRFASLQQEFELTSEGQRVCALNALTAILKRASRPLVDQIVDECAGLLGSDEWAEQKEIFASELPMTWDDAKSLTHSGATIGSHCHDHVLLHSSQPETEILRQFTTSKTLIEANVGPCHYFAYPNGTAEDICACAHDAARSSGFRMAFTTIEGEMTPAVDPFLAPRIWAPFDFEEFCYTLSRTGRQNQPYNDARLRWAACQ